MYARILKQIANFSNRLTP